MTSMYNGLKEVIEGMNSKNYDLQLVDDYVYINGEKQEKIDWKLPYVIVAGDRAVGKGVYAKNMSNYDKDIQYVTFQRVDNVHRTFIQNAEKIISIRGYQPEDLL